MDNEMIEEGWKPIETAPKDGTAVRLNGEHPLYPLEGRFEPISGLMGQWQAVPMRYHFGPAEDIPDPTHWQPLPEPPSS